MIMNIPPKWRELGLRLAAEMGGGGGLPYRGVHGSKQKCTKNIFIITKWYGIKYECSRVPDHISLLRNIVIARSQKYEKSNSNVISYPNGINLSKKANIRQVLQKLIRINEGRNQRKTDINNT